MKKLKLNNNMEALVDDADYNWLNQWKWKAYKASTAHGYYIMRHEKQKKGKSITIYLHRFIMNAPKNMQVDHRDMNGFNCQRANLRLATHTQNKWNRLRYKNSVSKYKGVDLHKQSRKWRARIGIGIKNKPIELGLFTSETDAAKAYNQAAIKYHGEFARLNTI